MGPEMLLREFLRRFYYFPVFRRLKKAGNNIMLSRGGTILRPGELAIGDNVFISKNFYISARSMTIGNNVLIGPNFLAECDDHIFDKVGVTMFSAREDRNIKPIIIENDVWIGGNVTILKGSIISEGCVIGAGSVVTNTMPPYCICFGVPCRPVRPRFRKSQLKIHLEKTNSTLAEEKILQSWVNANLFD